MMSIFNLEETTKAILPKLEGDRAAQKALNELIIAYQAEQKIKNEYYQRLILLEKKIREVKIVFPND